VVQDFAAQAASHGWHFCGPPEQGHQVKITFYLKEQNLDKLKETAQKVSDPTSPDYGHFLTKEQINAMTQPKKEHRDAVRACDCERASKPWLSPPRESKKVQLETCASGIPQNRRPVWELVWQSSKWDQ